ncbi:MAG: hypothetical protein OES47_09635, partial [Acidobacteriota bacterium]|nr:hypothetical protein [Acidobacteriota bacterium]
MSRASSAGLVFTVSVVLLLGGVTQGRAQLEGFEIVDVARVWSGHPVNFALETVDDRQYVAFYDDER